MFPSYNHSSSRNGPSCYSLCGSRRINEKKEDSAAGERKGSERADWCSREKGEKSRGSWSGVCHQKDEAGALGWWVMNKTRLYTLQYQLCNIGQRQCSMMSGFELGTRFLIIRVIIQFCIDFMKNWMKTNNTDTFHMMKNKIGKTQQLQQQQLATVCKFLHIDI